MTCADHSITYLKHVRLPPPFCGRQAQLESGGASKASCQEVIPNTKFQRYASTGIHSDAEIPLVAEYTSVKDAMGICPTTFVTNTENAQKDSLTPPLYQTLACPPPGTRGVGISNCYLYWLEQLRNHECTEYAAGILELVREGCPTGFTGHDENVICENWPSCIKFKDGVSDYIAKHRSSGAIVGPLYDISNRFRCSPLGGLFV